MQAADLAVLAALGALAWFWAGASRARERAVALCRDACARRGVQLLDQTVALERLGAARDAHGRLRWRRHYRFEFTRDGGSREQGTVVMLGALVVLLEMPGESGRTYEPGDDA